MTETDSEANRQWAPYPYELDKLLNVFEYKDRWRFRLRFLQRGHTHGLTLQIDFPTLNTYHPEEQMTLTALFAVPPETWDRDTWQRWLFDILVALETHELSEWFRVGGERPYSPDHSLYGNAYSVRERTTHEQVDERLEKERVAREELTEMSEEEHAVRRELGLE